MKKKQEKNKQAGSGRMLVILIIVCIGLMAATLVSDFVADPVRTAAGYVITPFQNGINRIGKFVDQQLKGFRDSKELAAENEALQKRIGELMEENNQIILDEQELERLRRLYDLDRSYLEYTKIPAEVISRDPGSWYSTFVINRGTADGIAEGMNVLADGGLAGIVTKTGQSWAEVRAIIHDESSVSAMVVPTQENCIVSGNLQRMESGLIDFSGLKDDDGLVKEGAAIVTSAISSEYLPGLLIGYVAEVRSDPNRLTKSGTLTPAVSFRYLREVLVIREKKQTKD